MSGPTHLRLLASGWFLDVDPGPTSADPVAVTRWLARPGAEPLLVDDVQQGETFGQVQVSTRRNASLPGTPR